MYKAALVFILINVTFAQLQVQVPNPLDLCKKYYELSQNFTKEYQEKAYEWEIRINKTIEEEKIRFAKGAQKEINALKNAWSWYLQQLRNQIMRKKMFLMKNKTELRDLEKKYEYRLSVSQHHIKWVTEIWQKRIDDVELEDKIHKLHNENVKILVEITARYNKLIENLNEEIKALIPVTSSLLNDCEKARNESLYKQYEYENIYFNNGDDTSNQSNQRNRYSASMDF